MRIVISGTGHVGSWLAGELRRDNEVAVYDRVSERLRALEGLTVLSRPSEIEGFEPRLFINAVTLANTVQAFEEWAPYLPADCMICDVASIKTGLAEYYGESSFRFVSVHPMFGPTFATMDSLREENAVIITGSDPEGARFFRQFFTRLGLTIFEHSFEEHDRMMASSLTLPFIASLVFAACVKTDAIPGTTFKRHMAIAKGLMSEDDNLLAEILFNDHSITQIEKAVSRLTFLQHVIAGKDREELFLFFGKLRGNIS
jgi:prephenate dehydrogenase